jgi:hypothetical protein
MRAASGFAAQKDEDSTRIGRTGTDQFHDAINRIEFSALSADGGDLHHIRPA